MNSPTRIPLETRVAFADSRHATWTWPYPCNHFVHVGAICRRRQGPDAEASMLNLSLE
jgi:hypothetical protein